MPEKTKLESEIEIFRLRYEQKLRNRRVRVDIDGYDIDTVIMALDNYAKQLNRVIMKLLHGNSIHFYSETVKRYYSAVFLKDYLMEQADNAIRKERKEKDMPNNEKLNPIEESKWNEYYCINRREYLSYLSGQKKKIVYFRFRYMWKFPKPGDTFIIRQGRRIKHVPKWFGFKIERINLEKPIYKVLNENFVKLTIYFIPCEPYPVIREYYARKDHYFLKRRPYHEIEY